MTKRGNLRKPKRGIARLWYILDTQSDLLHNNLGYNLLLQGRKDEAVAEFRAALQLNSRSQVARNNLGIAVASQPGEAISTWQSISDAATAHNNMAAVLMEQKRYQEARQELEIALGYRRDHPAALSNLSLLSETDKTPLTLPGKEDSSFWKRFGRGMHRAFVGEQVKKQSGPIESASR